MSTTNTQEPRMKPKKSKWIGGFGFKIEIEGIKLLDLCVDHESLIRLAEDDTYELVNSLADGLKNTANKIRDRIIMEKLSPPRAENAERNEERE